MSWIRTVKRFGANPLFERYVKFCVVGGTGMLVDMGIIYLLASPFLLGWNLSLSKVIAAEAAIFNNFVWNDLWTFRGLAGSGHIRVERLARFGKFNLICVSGIDYFASLFGRVNVLGICAVCGCSAPAYTRSLPRRALRPSAVLGSMP